MTDELTPAQRRSLEALRASRGACPAPDALVEYESLPGGDRARHPHHAHIQVCSRCQLALLHMGERGAPVAAVSQVRRFQLAGVLPLAALVVLAVALTLMHRSGGTIVPPANDTVRGTGLQVTAPAGAVEIVREFSWQSPIRAERYRVTVRRGTTVVWEAETAGLSVAPPPSGVLVRDVHYEWRVAAIDREGNVRMTSPPQSFIVY